jgi:hypothetical protein
MITEKLAKEQIARLGQLDGFPREQPAAIRELIAALMVCQTDALAIGLIDDIIRNVGAGQRCPFPADLRRTAYERQETKAPKYKPCERCGGGGWLTVWRIVTYKGKSFHILRSEPLEMDQEERMAFGAQLGENQDILSGAAPCDCLPETHHALTGEHK